jgi:hypothetical protein
MMRRQWALPILGVMAALSLLFIISSVFSTPGSVSFQAAVKPQRSGSPSAGAVDASLLSYGDSYDDFASVAVGKDGTEVAYAAYYDGWRPGPATRPPLTAWSGPTQVPL